MKGQASFSSTRDRCRVKIEVVLGIAWWVFSWVAVVAIVRKVFRRKQ